MPGGGCGRNGGNAERFRLSRERARARARGQLEKLREVSPWIQSASLFIGYAASRLRFHSDEYKIWPRPYGDPRAIAGSLRKPCNCARRARSLPTEAEPVQRRRETYSATRQFLAENLVKERRRRSESPARLDVYFREQARICEAPVAVQLSATPPASASA